MHVLPLLAAAPQLSLLFALPLLGDVYVDATNPDCAAADGTLAAPYCTVTAAIAAAVSGDTIHIAPGVYLENIVLGVPLTLVGTAGAASTILDGGNGSSQVVTVQSTSTAVLDGLTIQNGQSATSGGGIVNTGDLTLLNSIVRDNVVVIGSTGSGFIGGGGIFNSGDLTLEGTTVQNNAVEAPQVWGPAYYLQGGGIYSVPSTPGRTTVLLNSTIRDNLLDASNLSGYLGYTYAYAAGAGVAISSGSSAATNTLEMTDCTVEGNSASAEFASVHGAGVYLARTDSVITSSTIRGNSALPSLYYSATNVGGVVSQHTDSPITATDLRNSTISGNIGTGVLCTGFQSVGRVTIEHCTLTENTLRGLEFRVVLNPLLDVEVGNSIIAGNTVPGTILFDGQDVDGLFVSLGHNLIGEVGASTAPGFVDGVLGDQVGTVAMPLDAELSPLADNGGPTWTHALAATSPAVDAADPLSTVLVDQRGVPRPAGAADIGAFELASGVGLGLHVCDGVPNSVGAGATLAMQGSASLASNDLELSVAALPQQSLGYFLTSRDVFTLVNPGGSQGNLCIASLQMGRYAGQVLDSGTTGTVTMAVDLTAIPLAGAFIAAQPNDTWYWQYWYRDMNPTSTSNFSAARGLVLQ